MVLQSHFWLYCGFMLAKVTSMCKNGYLLNLVSEKLNFSSCVRKKLPTLQQAEPRFPKPLSESVQFALVFSSDQLLQSTTLPSRLRNSSFFQNLPIMASLIKVSSLYFSCPHQSEFLTLPNNSHIVVKNVASYL